jgi:hypothetical protein
MHEEGEEWEHEVGDGTLKVEAAWEQGADVNIWT